MRPTRSALRALSLIAVSRLAARALNETSRDYDLEFEDAWGPESAREHDEVRAARDDAGRLRSLSTRCPAEPQGVPSAFIAARALRLGGMRRVV
jgi:hypothetical protein